MAQPKTFLIQVLITVNEDGSLTTTYRSLFDPKDNAEHVRANVADRVGWMVQVVIAGDRKFLPYNLAFAKSNFFGVSSVDVPGGGLSPFLPVLALQDKTKYSITIPGLTTIDPDIQSGGDTNFPGLLATGIAYDVYWDTANPANIMTYSTGGGPTQPLPLTVSVGDQVTFHAVLAVAPAVSNFVIRFNASNGWASPFKFDTGRFAAAGASTAITPPAVSDTDDPGLSFPFTASILLGGNSINSSAADPSKNALIMKGLQRRARESSEDAGPGKGGK